MFAEIHRIESIQFLRITREYDIFNIKGKDLGNTNDPLLITKNYRIVSAEYRVPLFDQ